MNTLKSKSWGELAPSQKAAVLAGGAVQIGLLLSALNDLRRRPQEEINGPKALWFAAVFVNFIGPTTYFRFGRKH